MGWGSKLKKAVKKAISKTAQSVLNPARFIEPIAEKIPIVGPVVTGAANMIDSVQTTAIKGGGSILGINGGITDTLLEAGGVEQTELSDGTRGYLGMFGLGDKEPKAPDNPTTTDGGDGTYTEEELAAKPWLRRRGSNMLADSKGIKGLQIDLTGGSSTKNSGLGY
jgi:hypothetical protein